LVSRLAYLYHPEGFEPMVVLEQGVLSEPDAAVRCRGVFPEVRFQEIKGHLPHQDYSISFMIESNEHAAF